MLLLAYLLGTLIGLNAQNVTITPNGITPAGTHPRLSYDAILALPNPQEGDIAYDLTFKCLRVYTVNKWLCSYQVYSDNYSSPNAQVFALMGGIDDDLSQGVAVDGSGNVYVTGYFNSTANIGNTSATSAGFSDIFLAKYNSSGNLLWVQSAGGAFGDIGYDVAIDGNGNVYITGAFQATATFGKNTVNEAIIGSSGIADIFLAKYNSNGVFQWVRSAGGAAADRGQAIALDANGSVYVTGNYQGTANFNITPNITTLTSAGMRDIFLAKYDSNGTFQWVKSAGGASDDFGIDIGLDNSGKVYITGYYSGTINFGSISKTAMGDTEIFLTKYDPVTADWVWVQSSGGTGSDYAYCLAVDGSGNAHIAGNYGGTAAFGDTTLNSTSGNAYIAKYNGSGMLQWVRSTSGYNPKVPQGIVLDGSGNAYMTGYYFYTASFGTISTTAAGQSDIFVAKYNNNGIIQWVKSAGGANFEYARGIAAKENGSLFVIGYYQGTSSIGTSTVTSAGLNDVFIMRMDK